GALVRCGADGCWLAHGGHVRHIDGFKVDTIDTNGAGDTHDGAFIAALMAGETPVDAAVLANAAAALSTTRFGPATSPDLAETRRFLTRTNRHAGAGERERA
ncbi:PfkB family carbohydrate kinase, partial [Aestuariivirga sp.]|uniref:PfkB family carbohydrate kinase n=1 Tax=Aestuariivirga sp. TaxID=2650926 RepID=UPI0035947CE3